jgi:hypothetical protein
MRYTYLTKDSIADKVKDMVFNSIRHYGENPALQSAMKRLSDLT